MIYLQVSLTSVKEQYRQYYKSIKGGIDGYYEKTIVDAKIYELIDNTTIGYFSIHQSRGLTSLVVLPKHIDLYKTIFDFVMELPLFEKVLFTDKDKLFLNNVIARGFNYELQAYNFEADNQITTNFQMRPVSKKNHESIKSVFGEFISYNQLDLDNCKSFYYMKNDEYVSFGALEPLHFNSKRYCLSMIVNETYRKKNYGTKTVKFLIQYLQSRNLQVNARCYVKNEVSKKTLLKSGLHISNHLCKIESEE